MSAPPLSTTPTIPSSIQMATPFSYTITNSGLIPEGYNNFEPTYTLTSASPTTFSTVPSGSPDSFLTTVSIDLLSSQTPYTWVSFNGLTYPLSENYPKYFAIEIPWLLNITSAIEGGRFYVGNICFRLLNTSGSTRGILFGVDTSFPTTPLSYTESSRILYFTLNGPSSIYFPPLRIEYNLLGTTGFTTPANNELQIRFENMIFEPLLYTEIFDDTNIAGATFGTKRLYKGISYECIQSIPGFPPALAIYYGPTGYYNFSKWWPLPPLSEWSSTRYYNTNERVIYQQNIYKALLGGSTGQVPTNATYWVLSDANYPDWNYGIFYPIGSIVIYDVTAYYATFGNTDYAPVNPNNVYWQNIASPNNVVTFGILSSSKSVYYPEQLPLISISNTTSSQIVPFISGNNSTSLTFSSANGFQSNYPSLQLVVNQTVDGIVKRTTNFPLVINPVTITTTPTLTSPLSLVTYQPFGYTYSIPETLVNVSLRYNSNTTSTLLVPYIANGETQYTMTFGSTLGLTAGGTTRIVIEAILNAIAIANSDTTILTSLTTIVATPPIPTGTLSFYKYEPFSYTFSTNSSVVGASFQVSRSSSELQSFLAIAGDLQSVVFSGSFAISYSTALSLIVDLVVGGIIISTQTILVSVGPGRFFPPTVNQNFQLYQYENVSNTFGSNIEFLTVAPMTSVLSSPTLPTGLTFGGSANSWFIQGTPTLQVGQSNYQVIGSNSSNGRIVTSTVSIRVNEQLVRITPSTSTLTGLTVDTAITPIVTTTVQPPTIYYSTFNYTWTSLPDGLNFQNSSGSNVSQFFQPTDPGLTIILAGSPSLAFATSLSTSGGNLYQTVLTGTRTDQTGRQVRSTSLFNFSMAETVLISVSNSVTLYQSKPLGTTDVLITAGNFFSTATISNVIADSLPPGLSLVLYSGPNIYRLSGTPTEVNLSGSYTFTATNTNGVSRSVTATIPVNPDVVTFGGSTPPNGTAYSYIVSKTVTPIVFSATSTSTTTAPTYTASIPLANYGLTLNSVTGILSGTPTTLLSSTTVTITATNIFGTIATTTIQLAILADTFTWPTYTPTYFQNKEITPFQFTITTLSGRPILSFSSGNLPTGLVINTSGLLTGSPSVGSSGSFTIEATTGFTTSSQVYTYTIIADQLLIIQNNGTDTVSTVFGPNNENLTIAGGFGGGAIATSLDGITWTPATSTPITSVWGIAWNGSYWVAVGFGAINTIATSPDGINWTGRGRTVFTTQGNGIAWNGSYWVAVGQGTNTIATSSDGITWTPSTLSPFTIGRGIAWNGSLWVAVGSGTNTIVTSSDGITWTPRTSDLTNAGFGIAWNGSYWVAVGNGLIRITTSLDGINWTPRSSPFVNVTSKVAWNGSFWIAIESSGAVKMASSPDGIVWTTLTSQPDITINDITWNGSLWVVVGYGGSIIVTSPDGVNWTSRTSPLTFGFSVASKYSIIPSQGVQYRAIEYSSDSFVNAVFSIGSLSPATSSTIAVTSGGLLSGDFTGAVLNTTYSATLTAVYQGVTATTLIYIVFTSLSGSGTGTVRIPTELSTLTFTQPTQTVFTFFEYVPYTIPIQAIGSGSFIYYFSSAVPNGFQLIKDSTGVSATLSGISTTIDNQGILIYAKTATGFPTSISITLKTITPFFINPQVGAGAYTAILRNDVEANAAQNARDNRTFPEVNPLAGPLMAPRAPDVVTPSDCILKLCKKPCPTCHTMM